MAALRVDRLPEGAEWLYEVKLDGYRALVLKDGPHVRLVSRNDKDLSVDFPHVVSAAARIQARTALIDGEIVAVDPQGIPRFQMLQHRSTTARSSVLFYGFDLLHLNGEDLTGQTLDRRRSRLQHLLAGSALLFSESLEGTADEILAAARALGVEGVVAKRRDSVYEAGRRTGAWRKLRLSLDQEFVVGGCSPGNPFDAILVGYFERGQLLFCGRVRAGFSQATRRQVFERIRKWQIPDCPFSNLPSRKSGRWNEGVSAEDMATMTWVKPRVVVQIAFVEWTTYDLLRHAAFVGLRDGKRPEDVRRERPTLG